MLLINQIVTATAIPYFVFARLTIAVIKNVWEPAFAAAIENKEAPPPETDVVTDIVKQLRDLIIGIVGS